jgi:hypothetical protein
MEQLEKSGLLAAAQEFHVGVNGWEESRGYVQSLIPKSATVRFHGLGSRSENLTLVMLEEWVKSHPGWNVLYFHSKGATHQLYDGDGQMNAAWRRGMMLDMVQNWSRCVNDLQIYDVACPFWLWDAVGNGTQHIPAGNFLWATSDFCTKLPSIHSKIRIKESGIAAVESRYEAEVYWGCGPKPKVRCYRPQMWWWMTPNAGVMA